MTCGLCLTAEVSTRSLQVLLNLRHVMLKYFHGLRYSIRFAAAIAASSTHRHNVVILKLAEKVAHAPVARQGRAALDEDEDFVSCMYPVAMRQR